MSLFTSKTTNYRTGFVDRGGYRQYYPEYFDEQGPDLPVDRPSFVDDHARGCDRCAGAGKDC